MNRLTVGIVDYGVGNLASVTHALHDAGFRVRLAGDTTVLDACDVLLLPGVGAFPSAMKKLRDTGLDVYLRNAAKMNRPLLGICLGMQLLAEESFEMGHSQGLGILVGKVIPLRDTPWHIGWNSLKCTMSDSALQSSHNEFFYFNHSFALAGASEHVSAVAHVPGPITAAVRHGRIAGLQFHPEKSQRAGTSLLRALIQDIAHA
ncbi:imidazole glycerol phosphate synthase subunit HisH [Denitromonas sp.]|uniref:imidazole glycerol phosphate synthase subunit HisH n=1 Tax=Denitromonas sp. TaxID=2734609 RepID=UPI003A87D821